MEGGNVERRKTYLPARVGDLATGLADYRQTASVRCRERCSRVPTGELALQARTSTDAVRPGHARKEARKKIALQRTVQADNLTHFGMRTMMRASDKV